MLCSFWVLFAVLSVGVVSLSVSVNMLEHAPESLCHILLCCLLDLCCLCKIDWPTEVLFVWEVCNLVVFWGLWLLSWASPSYNPNLSNHTIPPIVCVTTLLTRVWATFVFQCRSLPSHELVWFDKEWDLSCWLRANEWQALFLSLHVCACWWARWGEKRDCHENNKWQQLQTNSRCADADLAFVFQRVVAFEGETWKPSVSKVLNELSSTQKRLTIFLCFALLFCWNKSKCELSTVEKKEVVWVTQIFSHIVTKQTTKSEEEKNNMKVEKKEWDSPSCLSTVSLSHDFIFVHFLLLKQTKNAKYNKIKQFSLFFWLWTSFSEILKCSMDDCLNLHKKISFQSFHPMTNAKEKIHCVAFSLVSFVVMFEFLSFLLIGRIAFLEQKYFPTWPQKQKQKQKLKKPANFQKTRRRVQKKRCSHIVKQQFLHWHKKRKKNIFSQLNCCCGKRDTHGVCVRVVRCDDCFNQTQVFPRRFKSWLRVLCQAYELFWCNFCICNKYQSKMKKKSELVFLVRTSQKQQDKISKTQLTEWSNATWLCERKRTFQNYWAVGGECNWFKQKTKT